MSDMNDNQSKIKLNPITLAFTGADSPLEPVYLKDQQQAAVKQQRIMVLLGVFVYLIFVLVDWNSLPHLAPLFTFIRLCVFTPVALLILWFTYSKYYAKLAQPIMMVVSWFGAAGLLTIHYLATKEGFHSYRYAILFTLIFVVFFFTMRFVYILITTVVILIGYNLLQMVTGVFPPDIHADSNVLFLFIVLFGGIYAYHFEKSQRETYRLHRDLRFERDNVSHANAVLEQRVNERTESLTIANARLEHFSYNDQLTNLYNRRYFHEILSRYHEEEIIPVSIVVADINGLKLINDTFGFLTGDAYILKAVEALREAFGDEAILSRLGGDEFAVIQTGVTNAIITKKMSDFVAIAATKDVLGIPVSVSIGLAVKQHIEEKDEDIFTEAENRMFNDKLKTSPSMHKRTIQRMIEIYHERHPYEETHANNVSIIASALGAAAGLSDRRVEEIKIAGLYHDIGKITIDDHIFSKTGALSENEMELVRHHPDMGYRILMASDDLTRIAEYVLHHHERMDGTGYPRGLQGLDIPIQSRILAIADAYDAMTGHRCYKSPISPEEAIIEMKKHAGKQFDMELVFLMEKLVPEVEKVLRV